MPNKLTIILNDEIDNESSISKLIFSEYINATIGKERFYVQKHGKKAHLIDTFAVNKVVDISRPPEISPEAKRFADTYSVKVYSFKDEIKQLCINLYGLAPEQCYGPEEDRKITTHIPWANMPAETLAKKKRPNGNVDSQDLFNSLYSDIMLKVDENCHARLLYDKIKREGYKLAIVKDASMVNEITMATEIGYKAIGTEATEDKINIPRGEYSLFINNDLEGWKTIRANLKVWFASTRIFL